MGELPSRLAEIVEDFGFCEGQEKLEYLLEFAEALPPLPAQFSDKRDEMEEVHECITPVFIYAEVDNGRYHYHFDIPPEAPTVSGFARILQVGLDGLMAAEIMAIPSEFYLETGLQTVLSGQRLSGISAMLLHMKNLVK
ncbi:MAG: cysteine desulfuration protein SufE [Chloroflexi bacterium]|nr:MAG: cysteine desulfuration protein SufE [Chloroflexota bacterium]PIE81224.1 MAG: cysteine desulfuration protein SufE [Chloroflexota bacterium]